MSIRIFKSALIRQQLNQQELDDLAADFLSYKKDGVLPDTFGRDASTYLFDPYIKCDVGMSRPTSAQIKRNNCKIHALVR